MLRGGPTWPRLLALVALVPVPLRLLLRVLLLVALLVLLRGGPAWPQAAPLLVPLLL